MQGNLRLIRVFIGSPGGLENERLAAHSVVKEINQHNSDHWGCLFKLMGWEEAIPGYRRAQDKINEDLDRCEYFIGVMWNSWGSKPSNDPNGYTSGFEEEYHRSRKRIEDDLMKDMALFFKRVEVPPGMEPGTEIKRVLDFRQDCIDSKKVFFRDFADTEAFRDAVRAKLMEIGWREYNEGKSAASRTPGDDQPPLGENETEASTPISSGLIDEDARDFLTEILQRPADWHATESREIARFRLISSSVSRTGNDDDHLGTHDANLVFQFYRDAKLSDQELTALIDCGVAGFSHQNVPLWRWIAKADMGPNYLHRLRLLATVGSNIEQVGAIKVLQRLGSPLPTHDGDFNKTGVLAHWLSDDTDSRVLDAVASFLGTNAVEDEIYLIEEALTNLSPYNAAKFETAIVEVVSRRSTEDALRRVCERNVSNIETTLASKLLANPQSLTTDVLQTCLSAKPDAIRIGAATILFERGEIGKNRADSLLTDESAEIRLIAAEVLHVCGEKLDDGVLEKALKVQKTRGFSLFVYSNAEPDATQLEIYHANRRAELDFERLVHLAEDDFSQYKCLITVFKHHGKKARSRIIKGLEDRFSTYFQRTTSKFREKFADDRRAIELLDQVIPSYQRELCNSGVAALCELSKPKDLALIRNLLDRDGLEANNCILQFLARHGDWHDVERILKLGLDDQRTGSVLSIPTISLAKERAVALLAVGRDRIADLLTLELDTNIRTHLLKEIPKSTFVSLPNDLILRELNHANADSRAIVALRCVQILSKIRVTELLKKYCDGEKYRFYNSIHWLDLGASLPSKLCKSVAAKELDSR